MERLVTTSEVSKADRLDYWYEQVKSQFVTLEVSEASNEGFSGAITKESFGEFDLSTVRSSPQMVSRTENNIRQSSIDNIYLLAQIDGSGQISQNSTVSTLSPGGWTFVDTTCPYELYFKSSFTQLVLAIPRDLEPLLSRRIPRILGANLATSLPMGNLVYRHLVMVAEQIDNTDSEARALLANSVISTICAAISQRQPYSAGELELQDRVNNYINDNLCDPRLCATTISAGCGISIRYLHKLFEKEDVSVSAYIRNRRMEYCYRDLVNPRLANRNITDIALSRGFNNLSHFSTLFKKTFGQSAQDLRRHGQQQN